MYWDDFPYKQCPVVCSPNFPVWPTQEITRITFSSGPRKTRKDSLLAADWPQCCPEFLILGGWGWGTGWMVIDSVESRASNLSSSLVKLPSMPLTCKAYFWPSSELNSEQLWTFCAIPLKLQVLPGEDNGPVFFPGGSVGSGPLLALNGIWSNWLPCIKVCGVQVPLLSRCVLINQPWLSLLFLCSEMQNGGRGRGCS